MCKGRRKINVENTKKDVKVKISEEEEIKNLSVSEKFSLKLYMRKLRKAVVNRNRLECVSVVEEVKLII